MYGKNQNSGISELRQELRKSSQYKNFRPYLIIAIGERRKENENNCDTLCVDWIASL